MPPAALADGSSPQSPVLVVVCSAQWGRLDAAQRRQREDLAWVELSLPAA